MTLSTSIRDTAAALLRDCINRLSTPVAGVNGCHFDGREWHSRDDATTGFAPRYSVASGAAALWRFVPECPGRATLFQMATAATDHLLDTYSRDNGVLINNELESMFCGVELASIALDLGDALDAARRERWTAALERLVAFLIQNGNLADTDGTNPTGRNWYTNGNIELDELLLLALIHQLTGDARYAALYETQLAFLLDPAASDARWQGFGLTVTRQPQRADGSDGCGFLAEAEGVDGRRGWDPDYTMFQTNITARVFLATNDARLLRLLNLLVNQEFTRIDTATWQVDCTGGSRRNNKQPFWSNALAVLAFQGGRADLVRHVVPHLAVVAAEYRRFLSEGVLPPGLWRGTGTLLPDFLRSAAMAADATTTTTTELS